MRNIAKKFKMTMSLIDIETVKPRYKCFFGEDVELCISVVDEDKKPLDLTDVNAKVYYTCDKFEPLRQDNDITINEPYTNGTINILVNKKYLRLGVNTIRVALFDSDQEVLLQPCQVNCIETGIGDEHGDVIVNDDINVKDEFIKTNNKVSIVDNRLKAVEGDVPEIESRLTNFSEQLDKKAEKVYVDTKIGNMGNTKTFKGSCLYSALPTSATVDDYWYVTDRATNYCWNGTTWIDIGNNLNIGNNTITKEKIVNKEVTEEKTNFLIHDDTTNYVDKTKLAYGYIIRGTDGKLIPQADWACTDFIELKQSITYYRKSIYSGYYAFYDANKKYISGANDTPILPAAFTLPENAVYIRVSIRNVATSYDTISIFTKDIVADECRYKTKKINIYVDNIKGNIPIEKIDFTITNPTHYSGNECNVFKNGVAIGDSLTAGVFDHNESGSNEGVAILGYAYPNAFTRITGIPLTKQATGGISSKGWYEKYNATSMSGYDFAIINLGTNDPGKCTIAETKEAFNNIIAKLKAENKGIKIFIGTILPTFYNLDTTNHKNINDKIKEIVSENDDCYLLDMTEYSSCKSGTYYAQGHLTALGYLKEATEIKNYIGYIVSNNMNDFRNVQFIGTGYDYN